MSSGELELCGRDKHRHSKIVNSKLSMTSIISGRLNWVIRIIIMKQGHWFRTSFDIMIKDSTIKAFICMARALETMVRLCSSKARTCLWISGIDWINCQARVNTRHELSFCPTVVWEKKKLVTSNFASVWMITDFPTPAGPYTHKKKRARFSIVRLELCFE